MNAATIFGLSNIITGLVVIAACIPLLRDNIAMNRWYGIRFRKSFESEENWYAINSYGAQRMILWSVIIVNFGILSFFVPISGRGVLQYMISGAPVLLLIPAIESWLFARKL